MHRGVTMIGSIIPSIVIYKANKNLRMKNSDIDNIEIPENLDEINIQHLRDDYQTTLEVKNRFEDKAKTIIAALTIAITLILNLSKIIDTVTKKVASPYFSFVIFAIAFFSIVFMLMAGVMSIQVLIKENLLFRISLEDRENKESIFINTQLNINQNLIRNNIIYAAYLYIRNSVICLLTIFVIAIWPSGFTQDADMHLKQPDNIVYSEDALQWFKDNTEENINFSEIIKKYNEICDDQTQKNIYDNKQNIIVTIEYKEDSFLVSDIKDDISQIN